MTDPKDIHIEVYNNGSFKTVAVQDGLTGETLRANTTGSQHKLVDVFVGMLSGRIYDFVDTRKGRE